MLTEDTIYIYIYIYINYYNRGITSELLPLYWMIVHRANKLWVAIIIYIIYNSHGAWNVDSPSPLNDQDEWVFATFVQPSTTKGFNSGLKHHHNSNWIFMKVICLYVAI